jgi:putative hemolysin
MIDLGLLLVLILINGVFAMSEIALVSSRKPRLQQLASEGHAGARLALSLANDPTRFLSTVQVGITSIGILSGAVGESAIALHVQGWLSRFPLVAPHAQGLSLVVMVVSLTYVSLILGELVPKRLGLTNPERIASLVAGPMSLLSAAGRPLVHLLSASTDLVLALLRVSRNAQPSTSDEEIKLLMAQGAEEGVFEPSEQAIVSNVLHLDDRYVGAILTPRADVTFLDLTRSWPDNARVLESTPHSVIPLCRGGLDEVTGVVRSSQILGPLVRGETVDLEALASPALFGPRTTTLMALLQQFRQTHLPVALVVDEFGSINGLVSLTDVTAAIVGDLPETTGGDPWLVRRDDGTWLVDGAAEVAQLEQRLQVKIAADDDERQHYHTLGGLAMYALGRVPRTGDTFTRGGVRLEIVDMDGHRVDRLIISPVVTAPLRNA